MGAARRRATILGIAAALSGGCQLLVPSDVVQCKTSIDCEGRGGEFGKSVCVDELCVAPGDACLGRVLPIVEDRTVPLRMRLRFVSVSETPLPGLEIFVCAARDEPCSAPVGPPVITDAQGYANLPVWKNFRGTFQIKSPPAGSDLMKTKLHVLPSLEADASPDVEIAPERALHLVTRTLLSALVAARAPLDTRAGHVLGLALDCTLEPRAGVSASLTSDARGGAIPFYFVDRVASLVATETASEGSFGVVNVPAGPVAIEATLSSSGRKFARVDLWLNEDTITTFLLVATPDSSPR